MVRIRSLVRNLPIGDLCETPSPVKGEGRDGGERGFTASFRTLPVSPVFLSRIEYWAGFSPERRSCSRVSNWERRRQPLASSEVRVEIRFTLHNRRRVMLTRRALIGSTAVLATGCGFLESRFTTPSLPKETLLTWAVSRVFQEEMPWLAERRLIGRQREFEWPQARRLLTRPPKRGGLPRLG